MIRSNWFIQAIRSDSQETDSDDEGVHDFKDEKDSKVVKMRMNSLRADLVVKAGLGIARKWVYFGFKLIFTSLLCMIYPSSKVEVIFYESKIRVNGKKISKKSSNVSRKMHWIFEELNQIFCNFICKVEYWRWNWCYKRI